MSVNHFASLIMLRAYKDAQSRQRSIAFDLRKATKQSNELEKEINAYKRSATNEIKARYNMGANSFSNAIFAKGGAFAEFFDESTGEVDWKGMQAVPGLMQNFAQSQAQMQAQMAQMQQLELARLEQQIEERLAMELEPLKEYAEDLQIEKQNADIEAEEAKSAYEATKKMAQDDIKDMWA